MILFCGVNKRQPTNDNKRDSVSKGELGQTPLNKTLPHGQEERETHHVDGCTGDSVGDSK